MDIIGFEVGKRFPLLGPLSHFSGGSSGASLSYDSDERSISLYAGLPRVNNVEALSFQEGDIQFSTIDNDEMDTSLLFVRFGDLEFDLIYDMNISSPDSDGVVLSNALHMFLIDSDSGILKAMRSIGLGPKFMKKLNQITKCDMRYTSEEYHRWIQDLYRESLTENIGRSTSVRWDE